MTTTLLWDTSPGEIRAGLVENGALVEFRIFRPQTPSPAPGAHYTARILRVLDRGKAAVELGRDCEAVLENAPKLPEGSLIAVKVVRAPLPEPGRWKSTIVHPAPDVAPKAQIGWHLDGDPRELFLSRAAAIADVVICADAKTANVVRSSLKGANPPVQIDPDAIADAGLDDLVDASVAGEFAIAGGTLSIERTRAMTMVDIDGGGDPLALNLAAAREVPRLLRLLDIGGQTGIDFLALPDRKARLAVDAALAEACAILGPHERTAINGFGFAQIVRPRPHPSIPEILCSTSPGRLSVESRAIALLRAAARSQGYGNRQLVSAPAVIDTIRQWHDELSGLEAAVGAAIELVSDPAASGYGHVHVSQS